MKMIRILLLLISFIFVFSCKKTGTIPDTTRTILLPTNGGEVITANNEFAFRFLNATLSTDQSNSNKLISPLSIYLAFSMLYNGANNSTKDSMAMALQVSGIDINNLNAVCHSLIQQLPKEDSKVQLSIANSIWYRQNSYQPYASFLDTVQTNYNATVQGLDFNSTSAVNSINNWVAENTNNKITDIIKGLSPNDLMYLINAIYFNGSWKNGFKTSDTHNDVFYLANGSTETVPFMRQTFITKMFADSSFTMLELPYGAGNGYSMYVVQPTNPQQSLGSFASSINENILTAAITKMDSINLQINLPKWTYSYAIDDMKPALSMLGMGIAFGEDADFSKIYDPSQAQVYISKAIHKTYIKVNEEGTEAAAVTAIGIETTLAPPPPPVIRFDHPFFYAIIEKQTGTILFLGIMNDPLSTGT